jgi:hypothetical protein
MEKSNKIGSELDDQTVHLINEILHSPKECLGLEHVRLDEGYLKGDFQVFVFFRLADNYCLADLKHIPEVGSGQRRPAISVSQVSFKRDFNTAEVVDGCEKRTVLIGNVQFVEYPEIVALPVFVRFGAADSILRGVSHSLYFSTKRGFIDLIPAKDREHSLVADFSPRDLNEMAGKVIKRTTEIVDDVSRDQGKIGIKCLKAGWEKPVETFVSGLRIRLGADAIGYAVDDCVFEDFEILEVCIGPFDFSSDERKSFIGIHREDSL